LCFAQILMMFFTQTLLHGPEGDLDVFPDILMG
jgi:hypothetical protein